MAKISREALHRWREVYRKAVKDFGSKAQAERIAWGAVDEGLHRKSRRASGRPTMRRKRVSRAGRRRAA